MTKPTNQLSPQETQVFLLRMDGLDTPAIAKELGLATNSVKVYLHHVRGKLGGGGKGNMWWVTVGRAYERQQMRKGGA